MKITLINTNTIRPPLPPIGLLTLSGYLRSKGHGVRIVESLAPGRPSDPARTAIEALRENPAPDAIGFSIRNIDTTQMKRSDFFIPGIAEQIRAVRGAYPRVPLVLGGAGFSLAPREILALTGADFGVVGEGERALDELLRRLKKGRDFGSIPGLVYRDKDGRCLLNPAENMSAAALSRLPFQAVDLVDYGAYFDQGGMASVQTKRGCALGCSYCTYPLIEGRAYRLIDPVRVVDELAFLAERGYDYFHFADSVFNIPRAHAVAICREIVRRGLRIRWHAYMSPFGFDDEFLDMLIQAGSDGVQFGVDSCSERMLRAFGKNFTNKDISRAAEACRGRGMDFALNILIGAPGENLDSVEETLRFVDEVGPTAVFITQGVRVYRGTAIHAELVKKGVIEEQTPLLSPYYYFSESLPPDISERLLDFARSRDFAYCDADTKPAHCDQAAAELYRKGFRGPMWRVMRKIREDALAAAAPVPA